MRSSVLSGVAVMCLAGCSPTVIKQSAPPGSAVSNSTPSARTYEKSPEVIAHATIAAIRTLGWEVDYSQSRAPHVIAAKAPMSLWTYGDRIEVDIRTEGAGKTTVSVTSRTDGQVYDWGKNEENIRRFYPALESELSSGHWETIAGAKFTDIVVTAGPISQPYEVLGEVHVNTRGMINFGSALNDALFRSPLAVAAGGRTPVAHTEQMNKFLKEKAREQYGNKVDAIINTTYNTDHDGDVFASGLAVHFVEQKPPETQQQAAPPGRHLEDRLKELKDLREKGLISVEEYNQKRQELLQGL